MPVLPPVPAADLEHILTVAEKDFQQLQGARIFITGGTGFFGTWLLEAIAAANARLNTKIDAVVLSRNPAAFAKRLPHLAQNPSFSWHVGDVRTFASPSGEFSHIIHGATAASAALNEQDPREMFTTIVHGTERVLEYALGCQTKNLLLISSGAVYGKQPPDIPNIPETYMGAPDPSDPLSAYAEGKRAAELLCALTPGLSSKIARCFAFIGPHLPLDAHFAAGNFLRDVLREKNIVIHGDGRPLRSYLHASDLVIWLLAILVRGRSNHPYNVGDEKAVSIAELARITALAGNKHPESVEILQPPGEDPPPRYVPDTNRAKNELELTACIGLPESIKSTLSWHSFLKDA